VTEAIRGVSSMTRRTWGYESVTECFYVPGQAPGPRMGRLERARGMRARDAAEVPTEAFAAPSGSHRRHRRAASRRLLFRRPGLALAALVAGGLVAGVLGFTGTTSAIAQPTTVAAAQRQALDNDQVVEQMPQASITVAEAQARLQEVAASRAQRAAADEAAREAARPKAVLPVNGVLSSCFCMRWGVMHWGIDLAAPMYTPEYAAMDGVVLQAGPASGFGLAVYILHSNGDVTVYGHMDSILVSAGQYVQAGQKIALLGMRGESTGPHLHFEIHRGGIEGTRIDPMPWLAERGVTVPQ
jgi:murein DD-endopeptidase MepM/ murein hydrolase activator NlpD